jgi:hypothetical protein
LTQRRIHEVLTVARDLAAGIQGTRTHPAIHEAIEDLDFSIASCMAVLEAEAAEVAGEAEPPRILACEVRRRS